MEETIEYRKLKNNDFSNERELKDYIIENKEIFCKLVLGVEYKGHVEEHRFKQINHLHDNELRVDIVFVDTNNLAHFIELKSPKNVYGDCMMGIGQCLSYYYLARVNDIKLADVYLITSKHCNLVPLIIRDNGLKIKYIYMDKKTIAKPIV